MLTSEIVKLRQEVEAEIAAGHVDILWPIETIYGVLRRETSYRESYESVLSQLHQARASFLKVQYRLQDMGLLPKETTVQEL